MSNESFERKIETTSTAIRLSDEQRQALATALEIDVKFVPAELGVLGVPRRSGSLLGMPVDKAGQFAPALIIM